MFCPNCGKQIPDESKFCAECGASLSAPAPQPEPQPAYQQPVYQQPEPQPAYQQPVYQQPEPQPAYQQPVYQQPQPVYQAAGVAPAPAKNNKKTAIIIGAVVAVVAAVAVALFFLLGGKGKTSASSLDALKDAFDGKSVFTMEQVKLLHPDFKDVLKEELNLDSDREIMDRLNRNFDAKNAKMTIDECIEIPSHEYDDYLEDFNDDLGMNLRPDSLYVPIGRVTATVDGEEQSKDFDENTNLILFIEEDGKFYWVAQ